MRVLLILASAAALAGCDTLAYYGQAAGGQLALVRAARPVADVLADPATDAALRTQLRQAMAIRAFAIRELALPDDGSYRAYADLKRPYAVWNVVSTPEFSLAPVQSCFPIAGCVAYRGYFARADAEKYAAERRAAGEDVLLYGVPAYSTLGWFDDPLLSTFIGEGEAELARLIFHELAHHVVYVKDDSTFNESFAVTVEREGLKRWRASRGESAPSTARREEFDTLIASTRATLEALYRTRLVPDEMRRRKREALAPLATWLARLRGFDGVEPNNAVLASFATYTQLIPMFEKLLAEEHGDLPAFYARVKRLASERSTQGPSSAPHQ
ncbi:MAG: aminopeptidase [Burkholderiales bacterium]